MIRHKLLVWVWFGAFLGSPFLTFAQMPGPGHSITFDGVNDYIYINASPLQLLSDFTFSAWIKPASADSNLRVTLYSEGNPLITLGISLQPGGVVDLSVLNMNNPNVNKWLNILTPPRVIQYDEWNFVAITVQNGGVNTGHGQIYVNGILIESDSSQLHFHPTAQKSAIGINIGFLGSQPAFPFTGAMDEVRLWSRALSLSEIRSLMCQKLRGSPTGLLTYWNMDSATLGNNQVIDQSGNGFAGTMTNMLASSVDFSEAPLGDTSIYMYPISWVGQSLSLPALLNQGIFNLSDVTGNPKGIHLYRTDALPNFLAGLNLLPGHLVYYGSFVNGGIIPQYKASWNYSVYASAIMAEPFLSLSNRDHHADNTWVDLQTSLDTFSHSIAKDSLSLRGEFILSQINPLLTAENCILSGHKVGRMVLLKWLFRNEDKVFSLQVERYTYGNGWKPVETQILPFSHEGSFLDEDLFTSQSSRLYRIQYQGFVENNQFSNVIEINGIESQSQFFTYPNPVTEGIVNLKVVLPHTAQIRADLYNIHGQLIRPLLSDRMEGVKTFSFTTHDLASGMYFVHIWIDGGVVVRKMEVVW